MDFLTDSRHSLASSTAACVAKKAGIPSLLLKDKLHIMMGSTFASAFSTPSVSAPGGEMCSAGDMPVWFVHIDDHFLEESFQDILHYKLTEAERQKVTKFMFMEDRKRALLSILLQHALIRETFHFTSSAHYDILRSKEVSTAPHNLLLLDSNPLIPQNKPYLQVHDSKHKADVGRWNFNVSHHGKYVGIVSQSHALVGLDIVDTKTRSQGINDVHEYVTMFSAQLTDYELSAILR